MSVPEHPLHFGPRTSITTPLRSKGLGFGLSCSCTLKYASSRGRGNVVIPKGFPRSVGRVESRLLGFPCFPYSVISMACLGNAFHKATITAKAVLGYGTVLHQSNEDVKTMPRLPPRSQIQAALKFGVEKCTSIPVPVLAIFACPHDLEPLLSERPATQSSATCCGYSSLLGTSRKLCRWSSLLFHRRSGQ